EGRAHIRQRHIHGIDPLDDGVAVGGEALDRDDPAGHGLAASVEREADAMKHREGAVGVEERDAMARACLHGPGGLAGPRLLRRGEAAVDEPMEGHGAISSALVLSGVRHATVAISVSTSRVAWPAV